LRPQFSRRITHNRCASRNVFRHYSASAYFAASPKPQARHNHGACTNAHVVLDHSFQWHELVTQWWVFVVTEGNPRPQENAMPNSDTGRYEYMALDFHVIANDDTSSNLDKSPHGRTFTDSALPEVHEVLVPNYSALCDVAAIYGHTASVVSIKLLRHQFSGRRSLSNNTDFVDCSRIQLMS
jgi:hypothetical protein